MLEQERDAKAKLPACDTSTPQSDPGKLSQRDNNTQYLWPFTALALANCILEIPKMADNTPKEVPWHAIYPTPKCVVPSLPRHELLQWFRDGKKAGKDFVLVDVRRTDFEVCKGYLLTLTWFGGRSLGWKGETCQIEANMIGQGGTIRGSINLPAHSLYPTLPAVYALLSSSGAKHVLWYCGKFRVWCFDW